MNSHYPRGRGRSDLERGYSRLVLPSLNLPYFTTLAAAGAVVGVGGVVGAASVAGAGAAILAVIGVYGLASAFLYGAVAVSEARDPGGAYLPPDDHATPTSAN